VSTHCNAGWLAFVDWGSALAPVYAATRQGQRLQVFVDETRPRGQGASLTSWELKNEGVEHAVIADNAFGWMAKRGEVQAVITGADRIARNGDVANKIGTFGHAAIARRVGIPFYVAFPAATVDADCKGGHAIPIEERGGDEVLYASGLDEADGRVRRVRVTPAGATARNPAFDVTDAELVDGLICEFGIFPATEAGVGRILAARDGLPGDSASERGRNPLAASIR
jgi:S-methyl-5-thioribose-1-phosphate isomerase